MNVTDLLFDCIERRLWDEAQSYIDLGGDMRSLDNHGYSAIDRAVMGGDTRIIDKLISIGLNVNDPKIPNPLTTAVAFQSDACFRYLIESGCDINRVVEGQISPLMIAISTKSLRWVENCIENSADVNLRSTASNGYLSTPLGAAMMAMAPLDIIYRLVESGSDVMAESYCPEPKTAIDILDSNVWERYPSEWRDELRSFLESSALRSKKGESRKPKEDSLGL